MVTMTHQMACRLLKSITVAVQMVLPHPIQYIFLRTSLLSCLSPVVICVMQVKSEYFYYWDCDNEAQWNEVGFSDTQSPRGGTGPGPTPDIRIDYCYYQPPPGE